MFVFFINVFLTLVLIILIKHVKSQIHCYSDDTDGRANIRTYSVIVIYCTYKILHGITKLHRKQIKLYTSRII